MFRALSAQTSCQRREAQASCAWRRTLGSKSHPRSCILQADTGNPDFLGHQISKIWTRKLAEGELQQHTLLTTGRGTGFSTRRYKSLEEENRNRPPALLGYPIPPATICYSAFQAHRWVPFLPGYTWRDSRPVTSAYQTHLAEGLLR